jgi:hypothetical protein
VNRNPHDVAIDCPIRNPILEFTMKTKLIATLFAALSAALAAPAFASGYGPAPFYKPSVGAPASQRGQSVQTLVAERGDGAVAGQDLGGAAAEHSQSGSRAAVAPQGNLFAHH